MAKTCSFTSAGRESALPFSPCLALFLPLRCQSPLLAEICPVAARSGSEFDRAYHKAWHEFGASLKDSTISETLLLAEIDLEQNDIPAGTPVGGEYIENPCIALFPADRKHSPIYIQLHTDPDFAVKSTGGEWFLPWLQQHGKRETRWEVDSLVEARQAAEAKARGGAEEQQPVKAKKAKKEKKKKKAKKSNKKFAVTIGDEKKVKKWGSAKRPTDYDRESVLTQELVCRSISHIFLMFRLISISPAVADSGLVRGLQRLLRGD